MSQPDLAPADDYDDEDYDPEGQCTWCGGEGFWFGDQFGDPGWYEAAETYPCPSCRGSGLRKDMVLG